MRVMQRKRESLTTSQKCRAGSRFAWILLACCVTVAMLACGSSDDDAKQNQPTADVSMDADSGCVPKTCEQIPAECGSVLDGCGRTLECGTCLDGETCGGGGVANQCGSGTEPLCDNGAVGSPCTCGGAVVSTGHCCGGIARSLDCVRVPLGAASS